jgi:OPA family glycerol-3-phosphate transporter-like MFS transporter
VQQNANPALEPANSALASRARLTIGLLVVGYSAFYLCRSNLSVATPLLIREYGPQGVTKLTIGAIASLGTLFYAFGKFLNGSLADRFGGKPLFLAGLGGAALMTAFVGAGGMPVLTTAWCVNRLVQSSGWPGMVRIASRWFGADRYGSAMGVVSLSFLFGDFASRYFLGQVIEWGAGWRGVFFAAAGGAVVVFLAVWLLLRESPAEVGLPEASADPGNVFGDSGLEPARASPGEVIPALLRDPRFLVVCILSLGFTLVRETFNTWTPQYLTEAANLSEGAAGKTSAAFPFFGGVAVLLAGFLSDRTGARGRSVIIFVGLVASIPILLALGSLRGEGALLPVLLLGLAAFAILGPYAFLAGAMALDFGGKRGSATASGWIDGVGYLGGILAGKWIGGLAESSGWQSAFAALAIVSAASAVAAAVYWRQSAVARRPAA